MLFRSSFRSPLGKTSAAVLITAEAVFGLVVWGFGPAERATGQPAPGAPQIGFCLSRDQTLRPIAGLPANLIVGDAVWHGATQAAFSNTAGLIQVGSNIFLMAVDSGAGGSPATMTNLGSFAFNEPAPVLGLGPTIGNSKTTLAGYAVVWLANQGALAIWTGDYFSIIPTDPLPGPVVSLLPLGSQSVALMVQSGGGIERIVISLTNGQVISNTQVDAQATSAHEQNGMTLIATASGLTVVDANGNRYTPPGIPAAVTFMPVSDEWIQVESQTGSRGWLVHLDRNALTSGTLVVSEIPIPHAIKPRRVAI